MNVQFNQKVFLKPNSHLQSFLEALSFQLLSIQLIHLGSAPLKSELGWFVVLCFFKLLLLFFIQKLKVPPAILQNVTGNA